MSYNRAGELEAQLRAAEIRTVRDVRAAVPPCVLIPPPTRRYDLPLPAYTAVWQLVALAPGPGTADAWRALDELVDAVAGVLDVEQAVPSSYTLAAGTDPLPAYLLTITEASE